MNKRTSSEIKSKAALAKKAARHHFGKTAKKIEFKPAGKTNFVFEVSTGNKHFIIRISPVRSKLKDCLKEQWVSQQLREKGVPVAEILEVGNKVIPLPYMLQEKIDAEEATNHPKRAEILKELGGYARIIHSIPTFGYGQDFDWPGSKISKHKTWSEYLEKGLKINDHLSFLKKQNFLSKRKIDKLSSLFKKISSWKIDPSLNHGDLRLKNVLVDKEGKIKAIIDWEKCGSNITPYWDFSIALHDLSIDEKQYFLEGYGLDFKEFGRMSYALTAFNLINYVPVLRELVKKKDRMQLQFYKLRINGDLNLFSL